MLNLSINLVLFLLLLVPHILTPMTWQEIKFKLNKTYTTIGWRASENDKEFYNWFSGFTDAEGNFIILTLPLGFTFKFSIGLHIDDLHVLNYIIYK